MLHFIALVDGDVALGLWSTRDKARAARWGMELSLTYPRCSVMIVQAASLAGARAQLATVELNDLSPEPVGRGARAPTSA